MYVIEGLVNVGVRPSLHEIHKAFNYVPADCVTTLHEALTTSNTVADNSGIRRNIEKGGLKPPINPKTNLTFVINLRAVLSLGEAEAVLAKAEAKSKAIRLLSEALAEQV